MSSSSGELTSVHHHKLTLHSRKGLVFFFSNLFVVLMGHSCHLKHYKETMKTFFFSDTHWSVLLPKNISYFLSSHLKMQWMLYWNWTPTQQGVYMTIRNINPHLWDNTRLAREQDYDVVLSDETSQHSLKCIHTTSLCIRHSLIQFKVLHRLHYSNVKLAKIYPGTSPECHHSPATCRYFCRCGCS